MNPFQQHHHYQQESSSSQISFSNQFDILNVDQDLIFNSILDDQETMNYNINSPNKLLTYNNTATSGSVAKNVDCNQKKIIRKENERQRRKQMSTLQNSLRSLLPLEAIKSKTSISDLMNAAVKHIEQLKKNTEELSVKRDKLKKLSNCGSVHVVPYFDGLEIMVSCVGSEEGGTISLSRIMQAVIEDGVLDVVSVTSARKDDRFYHTLHCQGATNSIGIDVNGLHKKLNDLILSTHQIFH